MHVEQLSFVQLFLCNTDDTIRVGIFISIIEAYLCDSFAYLSITHIAWYNHTIDHKPRQIGRAHV